MHFQTQVVSTIVLMNDDIDVKGTGYCPDCPGVCMPLACLLALKNPKIP